MNCSILAEYGIDYKSGIARCMNDASFYERMLGMFLEDDTFERAKEALKQNDKKLLFSCLHELKGACGNTDMTDLYAAVSQLVELLRSEGDETQILPLFEKIGKVYERTQKGIIEALAAG